MRLGRHFQCESVVSVSIVTRAWAAERLLGFDFRRKKNMISFRHFLQTQSGAHLACSEGTERNKTAGIDHRPQSGGIAKNAWNCNSTPPHTCIISHLNKQTDT